MKILIALFSFMFASMAVAQWVDPDGDPDYGPIPVMVDPQGSILSPTAFEASMTNLAVQAIKNDEAWNDLYATKNVWRVDDNIAHVSKPLVVLGGDGTEYIYVSGAGTSNVNGLYSVAGISGGRPFYLHANGSSIEWVGGMMWVLVDSATGEWVYYSADYTPTPDLGVWVRVYDGVAPVPDVVSMTRIAPPPVEYVDPVFMIDNLPGGAWTDFEFKGSTNNFEVMHYWYHSPDPAVSTVTNQVWEVRPAVYFTDSRAAEARAWIAQDDQQSIYGMLTDSANSYVGGWLIYVRGLGLTRAELEKWVWTYALMDGANWEEDPAGGMIWRMASPVRYVPSGTEPNL